MSKKRIRYTEEFKSEAVRLVHDTNLNAANSDSNSEAVSYVTLRRYAIQQLYVPDFLLTQSLVITRFPMEMSHANR